MIWDEFLRHFCFCDEEDSGLSDEEQFCKIVGRLRLYQFLPASEQRRLPSLQIGDQAVNAMVKGYVSNPDFGKKEVGRVHLLEPTPACNRSRKISLHQLLVRKESELYGFRRRNPKRTPWQRYRRLRMVLKLSLYIYNI